MDKNTIMVVSAILWIVLLIGYFFINAVLSFSIDEEIRRGGKIGLKRVRRMSVQNACLVAAKIIFATTLPLVIMPVGSGMWADLKKIVVAAIPVQTGFVLVLTAIAAYVVIINISIKYIMETLQMLFKRKNG